MAASRNLPLPAEAQRLGWISFFADVASEMAYPVMPLFLRSLGAPMAALGLIEGLADAISNVLKGVAGVRSDQRQSRLPYVRWGYGLGAIGKPLLALATGWPMVIAARALDRYGKGIRTTPRDALLADSAQPEQLGAVFGFHRAMDTAGAFVGVLLALLLLQLLPEQYRLIFVLAGVPGLVSLFLALKLRETSRTGNPATVTRTQTRLSPQLKQVIALHACFALANTSDAFLLLRARDQGFSETAVIAAYLLFNLTYVFGSLPAGRMSDRVGRWPLILGGWVIYAGVYVGFGTLGAGWPWALFGVYGIYQAMTQGAGKAQISELAPDGMKATALGVFAMTTGLCALAGNLAFGVLWDVAGTQVAFFSAAALALLAAAVGTRMAMRERRFGA